MASVIGLVVDDVKERLPKRVRPPLAFQVDVRQMQLQYFFRQTRQVVSYSTFHRGPALADRSQRKLAFAPISSYRKCRSPGAEKSWPEG